MKNTVLLFALTVLAASVALAMPQLNVRDFGAVGDGVADDTLALQRAADALHAAADNGRKHMVTLCDRYRKSRMDGPVGEVFFPRGTYRTTGPVVFRGSTFVRGEKGTVVRCDNPASVVFFFQRGYRTDVRGLAFDGGGIQIHVWTCNMESSTIVLEDAVFRNAHDTAFLTDSFRKDPKLIDPTLDYHSSKSYHSNIVYVSPYVESVASNGLWTLAPRDMKSIINAWNSTLCSIRNCRFENVAQAFRGGTDGIVIADSLLRGDAASTNALVSCGGVTRVIRCRLEPGPSMPAAVEMRGNNNMVTESTILLRGRTAAVRSGTKPFARIMGTIATLTDVGIEGAANPVFHFPEGVMAAMNSAYGVRSLDGKRRKMFDFAREPGPDELVELIKGVKARPGMPLENSISFATESVDGAAFDLTLPASLEICRAEIPADTLVRRTMTVSPMVFPAVEFVDETLGREMYFAEEKQDDTERLRALVARAAAAGGGRVMLPSRWIRLTGTVELPDNVEITCRGRAVLTMLNDAGAFFHAAEGVRARLSNLVFHRGRHALVASGLRGLVQLKNCYYYEQLEESIVDSTDGENRFRVEVVGGVANTAKMYRGNARPVLFDGFWSTIRSGHRLEEWREDYAGYVNEKGGWLEMYDILAVPNVFEHFDKMMKPKPGNPAKGTVRGRWVDNFGVFRAFAFRGGGEQGGFTLVYHHGDAAKTYIENHNCSTRNRRLKGGMAQVVADVETPDVTIVNLVTYNFTERPPVFASRLDEGEKWHWVGARVVNCLPFKRSENRPSEPDGGLAVVRTALWGGFDGKTCKVQPTVATDGKGTALMTFQKLLLSGCDVFYGQYVSKSVDGGVTWREPRQTTGLPDERAGDVRITKYATVYHHRKSDRFFALGIAAKYGDDKGPCRTYAPGDPYAWPLFVTVDAAKGDFVASEKIDLPFAYELCYPFGQTVELENGDLLVPFYFRPVGAGLRSQCVVLRYAFDGKKLKLLASGTPVAMPSFNRGVGEPSLVRSGGKFLLTIRSDECGMVAESADGLHFDTPKKWAWEDGTPIGNANTQQHWMRVGGKLYLAYTRKTPSNGHVFRNRAPVFLAEVDTDRICLRRSTEIPLVPERGARLGNFCCTEDGRGGSWLLTAEWMQPVGCCERYGSDNSLWLVKVSGKPAAKRNRGVLLLTFDDALFHDWDKALPLFDRYGAHATFFVNGKPDDRLISKMRTYQSYGHSVGLHSANHASAAKTVAKMGVDLWLKEEILPQLARHHDGIRRRQPQHVARRSRTHSRQGARARHLGDRFRRDPGQFRRKFGILSR